MVWVRLSASAGRRQLRHTAWVFAGWLFFWCILPHHVLGLEYRLPIDPIGPTTIQECKDLYERYAEIARALEAEAKVPQERANEILMGAGFALAPAFPYLDEASRIRREANDVRSRGSAAQNRCFQQVQAHQRNQSAQRQGQSNVELILNVTSQQSTVGLTTAGLAGYANGQFGRATSTRALAAGTLHRVIGNLEMLKALAGRGPTGPYSTIEVSGQSASSLLSEVGHFNRLQTYLANLAIGLAVDLNRSAMADLEVSLGDFHSLGMMRRFQGMAEQVSAQLSSPTGEIEGHTDLARVLNDGERGAAELLADRGTRAEAAIVRPAPSPTRVGGNGVGGVSAAGGRRYSPTQCQQLMAQIAEYQRVLPAYEAQGYGETIRHALQVNRAAFNEGCQ